MLGIRGEVRWESAGIGAWIVKDGVKQIGQGWRLHLEAFLDGELYSGAVLAPEIWDFGEDFVDAHGEKRSAGIGGLRVQRTAVIPVKDFLDPRSIMSPVISPGEEKWEDS